MQYRSIDGRVLTISALSARRARPTIPLAVCGLLALEAAALAAPPPAVLPTSAASPTPASEERDEYVASKKREAQACFQKGLEYYAKEAWDAALSEFVLSRATYPTRAATKNAALCLRKLRRFDEAFGMFEELLQFANLSEADRSLAQGAIAEIALGLGTLRIKGAAVGAALVVDGRYRGILPLPAPLRIGSGSHEVRAFREGLDLFGATVEVIAGREAAVTLRSLSTGGRLRLTEQRGRVLDVVIDGNVVGKTPWDGSLTVGEHLVTLRGSVHLDARPECAAGAPGAAGGCAASLGTMELGTQPVSVPIRLREATQLTLTAEPLAALLRIEPTPGGASVVIDSVVVGRGIWEGRLRVGKHKVEVMAEGFATELRRVTLLPHERQLLSVELERSVQAPDSRLARNVSAGASYGVGALGLGTFALALILAKGRVDDLKAACPNNLCPPTEQGRLDSVRTLETVSTMGLVVGGAGVVAGTIILLAAPSDAKKASPKAALSLDVGPGRFELNGSF
ncbi:MAG: PEGA domain-containing protein [Byssovorax sp.]